MKFLLPAQVVAASLSFLASLFIQVQVETSADDGITVSVHPKTYDLSDILTTVMKDRKIDMPTARRQLIRELALRAQLPMTSDKLNKPWYQWYEQKLIVRQSESTQQKVGAAIQQIRKHGFGSTMVEFRYLAVTPKILEFLNGKIDVNRENSATQMASPKTGDSPSAKPKPIQTSSTNKRAKKKSAKASADRPHIYGALRDSQVHDLFKRMRLDSNSRVIMAPKMVGNNGQKMSCFVGKEIPFVAKDPKEKTTTRFFKDGLTTSLTVTPSSENELLLDLMIEKHKVLQQPVDKKQTSEKMPHRGQPQIQSDLTHLAAKIRSGQTMVMTGPSELVEDNDLKVILLVTPRAIEKPALPKRVAEKAKSPGSLR